MKFLSGDETA